MTSESDMPSLREMLRREHERLLSQTGQTFLPPIAWVSPDQFKWLVEKGYATSDGTLTESGSEAIGNAILERWRHDVE